MLPDLSRDEQHKFLEQLNKPFFEKGCCACEVADDLLDDIRHAVAGSIRAEWLHVQGCPVCQSTLPGELCPPIPVELPVALEAVSA